jgi:hypothetical protein
MLRVGQRPQRLHGGVPLVAGGDEGQPLDHLRADGRIRIGARDARQHRRVVDPRDRGAPDARVDVFHRERQHRGGVLLRQRSGRQLGDRRRADFRIGRLVLGLNLEAVEERHWGALLNRAIWKSGIRESTIRLPDYPMTVYPIAKLL